MNVEPPWSDAASLAPLDRARRPFDPLTRRVVHAACDRFLADPPEDAPVVEVGAGLGQLRAWLPDRLRDRVTHTEPAPAYLAEFRRRHPDARLQVANAYHLPWPDGSLAAVLGLCVFDTLEEPARFRDELRRVLAPGGRFVHFLDLGTDLGSLFRELAADGRVPLPNFRHPDSADDLLLAPWPAFAAVVGALERDRHPHAGRLRSYRALFDPRGFDPYAAARKFMALISEPAALADMNRALREVVGALGSMHLALPLTPFSSWGHVRKRLEGLFVPEAGFRVELSDVLAAREAVRRDSALHPPAAFLGRRVGRTAVRDRVPAELCGVPVAALAGVRAEAGETIVVEAGVYVFVAVRC